MKAIYRRLARLEQVDTTGTINRIIKGFRLIGGIKGVLKVPVIEPGKWPCL